MRKHYLLTGLLLSALAGRAQLTGTKNIPGDYPDLSAAVTALNAQGVGTGGVLLNVNANQSTTTGYVITASGSAANPIVLQGNGKTLSMTGTDGNADAIIALAGSDHVTINGFVLQGDASTEWGILLGKKNSSAPFDGCQNNQLTGNTISLNKTNAASIGIYAAHVVPGATALLSGTGVAASDANSNNLVSNNTIGNVYLGIYFSGITTNAGYDSGNTIYANAVTDFGGSGANVYGIRAANFSSLQIRRNNVQGGATVASTAYGIQVGATTGTATIDSNTVRMNSVGTTSALNGIGSSSAGGSISITNNSVANCVYNSATTGAFNGIVNSNTTAPGPVLQIGNNTVTANSLSGTGTLQAIDAGVATSAGISGNTISNNSKSINGLLYGIRLGDAATITVAGNNIDNNGITQATTGSSSVYGIIAQGSLAGITETYSNNTITRLSINGTATSTSNLLYGLFTGAQSSGNRTIAGNIIGGLSSDLGGNLYGINQVQSSSASTASISANKVYDLNGNNRNSSVTGIHVGSGQTITLVNNLVGDLKAPAAFASNPLNGINIAGGTTVNVYFNTVRLNASSTGTSFGSSALTASVSSNLKLLNNILINTSASNGTGVTAAYRRSGTSLSTYTGNNNIFYAGTPGAFNLIYFDGTTTGSSSNIRTLTAYQALVAPQDNNSKTENTSFISVTGASTDFLHIASTTTTLAADNGQAITGFNTDFDGETRNASTPDIGADEFEGACSQPGSPVASNLTGNSVTITYTIGSGAALIQWELRNGNSCGSGTPLQSGTNSSGSFPLSNLTGGTAYTICLRRDCGGGSFSPWVSDTFRTVFCPSIVQQPSDKAVCVGDNIFLSVQLSASAGASYQWLRNGSPIAGANTATYLKTNATASDAGSYTVQITSPGCAITSGAAAVTIKPKPKAGFSHTVPGCAPSLVNFTNTSSIASGTFNTSWQFGDGTGFSSVANPSYTYTTPGNYTVSMSAWADGCSDTARHTLTIGQRPVAAFTNSTPGCAPATVNFTNGSTGSGTLTYTWNFGDGSAISTTADPAHVYASQGVYDVKLLVNGGAACPVDSVIRTVTVGCTTAVSNLEAGISDISLLPNIVRGSAQLRVTAARPQVLQWTLVDVQGRVLRRFSQRAAAGSSFLPLSFSDLAPGTYYLVGKGERGGTVALRFVRS